MASRKRDEAVTQAWNTISNSDVGMDTILEVDKLSYSWPGETERILRDITLRIDAGQCCCLTGPTGSGKSTLALAIKGLLPTDKQVGSISFSAGKSKVGLVIQNPETQLFASTLGEEVAFALENQGVAPEKMPALVATALQAVGLKKPFDSAVSTLSMGQKYRALLAATLVMQPDLLILDEPAAQLDYSGLEELRKVLFSLLQQGTALLLCEHRPQAFNGLIDRYWRLKDGRMYCDNNRPTQRPPLEQGRNFSPAEAKEAAEMVRVEALMAGNDRHRPLLQDSSFTFKAGQRVLVQGANGAGKSTLLRLLAGMEKPLKGEIKVFDQKPSLAAFRGRLGFLYQNPQRQLFEDRVIDEVGFTLKHRGSTAKERQVQAEKVLALCGIADLSERSPHKLSYGQKHLVALASVLASDPELLLLDDPFAGLDARCQQAVWSALLAWSEKSSATIVWTSHHDGEVPLAADMLLTIEGGQIASRTVHR